MQRLSGKTALVAGGGGRISAATARRMAQEGARSSSELSVQAADRAPGRRSRSPVICVGISATTANALIRANRCGEQSLA